MWQTRCGPVVMLMEYNNSTGGPEKYQIVRDATRKRTRPVDGGALVLCVTVVVFYAHTRSRVHAAHAISKIMPHSSH